MPVKKDIVLVTGSSGCLGEHIVKVFQACGCDTLAELRLYDRRPYFNRLGIPDWVRRTDTLGDINYPKVLHHALENVDCVIHCAAVVDTRILAENESMWLNNVEGTKAIISGCLKKNVRHLIFASTTAVVCGPNSDIHYEFECNVKKPTEFTLKTYAETKSIAEDLIIKANGMLCEDGETILKTVVLRPTPFYGERDVHFVPTFLRYAKNLGGTYYKVNTGYNRLQISYVGNIAWAFFRAKQMLATEEEDYIAGEIFFITDNTLTYDINRSVRPFIKAKYFRFQELFSVPFWLAWFIVAIITYVVRFVNYFTKKWIKLDVDFPSIEQLNYISSHLTFTRYKAQGALEYDPVFTPEESIRRSNEFYADIRFQLDFFNYYLIYLAFLCTTVMLSLALNL